MKAINFKKIKDKIEFISLSAVDKDTHIVFFELSLKLISPEEIFYIMNNSNLFNTINAAPLIELLDLEHQISEFDLEKFYGCGIDSDKNQNFLVYHFQNDSPANFFIGSLIINQL